MTTRKNLLDRVQIPSPCPADWDAMKGTDQIRYCSECHKYVYNLSEMTRREAEALLNRRNDQVCARIIRDLKGQTLTVESLPPVRLLGWKPGPVASAVVSAMISITPAAAPCANGQAPSLPGYSLGGPGVVENRLLPGIVTSAVTGVVSNEKGAALPGALVTLTSEASGEVLSQLTSEEGEFRFDGLAARTYIVEFHAKGYETVKHHDFVLKQGEARRLDVEMEKMIVMSGAVYIPAQPLRTLYLNSDRVIVAEVGKNINADREGSSRILRTSLRVSQTIKGDGHKSAIVVDQWVYGRDRGGLVEGETALLFLQRKDDARGATDTYELTDHHSSAKHLSSSDLTIYLQRIEELKVILGNSDSNPSDITEWLVRCAEEPATRREGAFELKMSAWREQFERQVAERMTADGEISPSMPRGRKPEALFAALLTSEHRQRLINVLLNTEDLALDGNADLIELVTHWNDPRLASFLISYLKRFRETAPESLSRVMQTVAGIAKLLDDPKITSLLRQYHYNANFDLEAEEAEGADSDEDDDPDSNEDEVADPDEAEEVNEDEIANPRDEVDTTAKTPEAARQVRVEILKRFLDAVESKLKLSAGEARELVVN